MDDDWGDSSDSSWGEVPSAFDEALNESPERSAATKPATVPAESSGPDRESFLSQLEAEWGSSPSAELAAPAPAGNGLGAGQPAVASPAKASDVPAFKSSVHRPMEYTNTEAQPGGGDDLELSAEQQR